MPKIYIWFYFSYKKPLWKGEKTTHIHTHLLSISSRKKEKKPTRWIDFYWLYCYYCIIVCRMSRFFFFILACPYNIYIVMCGYVIHTYTHTHTYVTHVFHSLSQLLFVLEQQMMNILDPNVYWLSTIDVLHTFPFLLLFILNMLNVVTNNK